MDHSLLTNATLGRLLRGFATALIIAWSAASCLPPQTATQNSRPTQQVGIPTENLSSPVRTVEPGATPIPEISPTLPGEANPPPTIGNNGGIYQIAFERLTKDGNRIFLMNSDGSGFRKLTNSLQTNGGEENFPSLSTDGNQIAYTYVVKDLQQVRNMILSINIISLDSLNQAPVGNYYADMDMKGVNFSWSPDGSIVAFDSQRFAFEGQTYESKIVFASADGKVLKEIKGNGLVSPGWSPDGQKIAYQSGGDIIVSNPDGTNKQIMPLKGDYLVSSFARFIPTWSTDSSRIAFEAEPSNFNQSHVVSIRSDGTDFFDYGEGDNPQWSSVTDRLLFGCTTDDGIGQVCTIDVNSTNRNILKTGSSARDSVMDAMWSPDGEEIVYNDLDKLWVMNRDGSNQRNILYDSDYSDQVDLIQNLSVSQLPSGNNGNTEGAIKTQQPPQPEPAPSTGSVMIDGIVFPTTDYCPDTYPSILKVGDTAMINPDYKLKQRVRSGPGTDQEIIGYVDPGKKLTVMNGPVCGGGWIWWKAQSKNGLVYWTAEGDSGDYWVVPYQ